MGQKMNKFLYLLLLLSGSQLRCMERPAAAAPAVAKACVPSAAQAVPTIKMIDAFTRAAVDGRSPAIELFLKDFPTHVDARGSAGESALFYAVLGCFGNQNYECIEVFKTLLAAGAHTKQTFKENTLISYIEKLSKNAAIAHPDARLRMSGIADKMKTWIKEAEDARAAKEASKVTPEEKSKQEADARAAIRAARLAALRNAERKEGALETNKALTVEQQLRNAQEEVVKLRERVAAANADAERLAQKASEEKIRASESLVLTTAIFEEADRMKKQAVAAKEAAGKTKDLALLAEYIERVIKAETTDPYGPTNAEFVPQMRENADSRKNFIIEVEQGRAAKGASQVTQDDAKQEADTRAAIRAARLAALRNAKRKDGALETNKALTVEQQLRKAQEEVVQLRARVAAADADAERLAQKASETKIRADDSLVLTTAIFEEADRVKKQAVAAKEAAGKAKDLALLAEKKVRELLAAQGK